MGTILLPAAIALGAAIAVVGRPADRQPAGLLVNIGLSLLALSFALMASPSAWGTSLWWLGWPGVIVGRIGLGFILPCSTWARCAAWRWG